MKRIIAECSNPFGATMIDLLALLAFPFILLIDICKLIWRVLPIGQSPFSQKHLQRPQPIETDTKKRDSVLKQSFHPSKIPDNLDAIIIGSGIGSLAVAVLMSRLGKRVLVLEQHDQAGGCCHTFIEKGFEFDTGIHYVGRLGNTKMPFRAYIDQLTNGQVQWQKMDDNFDTIIFDQEKGWTEFPMQSGKNGFWQNLFDRFPKSDHDTLQKYKELSLNVERTRKCLVTFKTLPPTLLSVLKKLGITRLMSSYFGAYAGKTPFEVMSGIGISKELENILVYQCNNGGSFPDELSFSMLALLTSHYERGSFYPVGGPSEIPFHMIPTIEAAGGRVLVRARVSEILFDEQNAAIGVRITKGSSVHDIYAPKIISDAGILNTFTKLVPRPIAERSRYFKYTNMGLGERDMYVFIGLSGSQKELNLPTGNYWLFTEPSCTQPIRDWLAKPADEAAYGPIPAMFLTFASAKDPSFANRFPGKSTCMVGANANYEWFSPFENGKVKHRGEEYESLKMEFGRTMWQQVLKLFPHLADKVEYFEVGTPLSNNHYLNSTKGELYGLRHGTSRFTDEVNMELRPETDIPGLYLTGQDVFTCGFAGAVYGGLTCAGVVLNRSTFFDLFRYTWWLQKSKP